MLLIPPLGLTCRFKPESSFHAWMVLRYPDICLYSNCCAEDNFQVLQGWVTKVSQHLARSFPLLLYDSGVAAQIPPCLHLLCYHLLCLCVSLFRDNTLLTLYSDTP